MDKILILISFIIFTLYWTVGLYFWGIPSSISATYYKIKGRKNRLIFYVLTQVLFSGLLIFTFLSHFLTMAGTFIIFSALAADTRNNDITERNHVIGATGGIIFGMVAMIQFGLWWIPLIMIAFTVPAMYFKLKNHTFWIEILAYYLIILGLLLY